jgi:hypothetical protein
MFPLHRLIHFQQRPHNKTPNLQNPPLFTKPLDRVFDRRRKKPRSEPQLPTGAGAIDPSVAIDQFVDGGAAKITQRAGALAPPAMASTRHDQAFCPANKQFSELLVERLIRPGIR